MVTIHPTTPTTLQSRPAPLPPSLIEPNPSGRCGSCRDGMGPSHPTNSLTLQSRPASLPPCTFFRGCISILLCPLACNVIAGDMGNCQRLISVRAVHPLLLPIRSVPQARSEKTDFSGFGKTRPKTCNTFPPISITIERGVSSDKKREASKNQLSLPMYVQRLTHVLSQEISPPRHLSACAVR
jgi:hypothetical protein